METNTNGSAVSLLTQLPTNRKESDSFAYDAIQSVKNGTVNPIELLSRIKVLDETFKAIKEANCVTEAFIKEYEKYGEKKINVFGCEVEIQYRKKYEFKDAILDDLNKQLEVLKAQIKAREATIKAGTNPETGEVYNAPMITSTPAFYIKLK